MAFDLLTPNHLFDHRVLQNLLKENVLEGFVHPLRLQNRLEIIHEGFEVVTVRNHLLNHFCHPLLEVFYSLLLRRLQKLQRKLSEVDHPEKMFDSIRERIQGNFSAQLVLRKYRSMKLKHCVLPQKHTLNLLGLNEAVLWLHSLLDFLVWKRKFGHLVARKQ